VGTVVGVENDLNVRGDFAFEMLFGDAFFGVLLEVKLAALPRCGVERSFECRFQAAVGVRCDQIRDADTALFEAGQEPAPVDFCLGECATDTEDHALAVIAADPMGDECGAVADNPVDADFVLGGVEGDVRDRGKRAGAPFFELGIELLVEVGDLEAAHLLHDPSDTARADPLDIHRGNG